MRQLVQDLRSGEVEVVDLPDPSARANRVTVRTAWSLISPGTEQAVSKTAGKSLVGKARDRPDQVRQVVDKALRDGVAATAAAVRARLDDVLTPGYSSVGTVEAVGPEVTELRPGDRVACVGANAASHAELASVPAPLCIPLPEGLQERWGAFGALGGIAAHGVRVADVDAGSVVVVLGLGLVGQLAAQLATAAGARVIGVDPSGERVELARRLGALAGARLGEDDVEQITLSLTDGHGADAVLVAAAAKDSGPVRLAATLARDRATISVVGDVGLDVPRAPLYEKELALRVSRSYGPGRYDASYEEAGHDYPIGYVRWTERRLIRYFLEEVTAGRIRLTELVSHEFTIDRGSDAYAALDEPGRMAILLSYPTPEADREPVRRATVGSIPSASNRGRPRVGLIGPGLFARSTLLPRLKQLDAKVVAVAGSSAARTYGVARRWGAGYSATDAEEILVDETIDTVVIATRHDSHADLAARALERGKAVFLEKPLAIDQAGLDRLKPLLEGGGRLVVDFNRGFAPTTTSVIAHLRGRSEPLHLAYRINAGFLDADHWLRDPAQGGGRLVGEGCHFVDLCSAVVGRPLRSVQVSALGVGPRTLGGDNFFLTLDYADGSLASIAYVSSGPPGMAKERLEVLGSGRGAVLDDFRRAQLHPRPRRTPRLTLPLHQDKGHAAILAAALRFFATGGEPPISYHRLLETTHATLLARGALTQGLRDPVALESE